MFFHLFHYHRSWAPALSLQLHSAYSISNHGIASFIGLGLLPNRSAFYLWVIAISVTSHWVTWMVVIIGLLPHKMTSQSKKRAQRHYSIQYSNTMFHKPLLPSSGNQILQRHVYHITVLVYTETLLKSPWRNYQWVECRCRHDDWGILLAHRPLIHSASYTQRRRRTGESLETLCWRLIAI